MIFSPVQIPGCKRAKSNTEKQKRKKTREKRALWIAVHTKGLDIMGSSVWNSALVCGATLVLNWDYTVMGNSGNWCIQIVPNGWEKPNRQKYHLQTDLNSFLKRSSLTHSCRYCNVWFDDMHLWYAFDDMYSQRKPRRKVMFLKFIYDGLVVRDPWNIMS